MIEMIKIFTTERELSDFIFALRAISMQFNKAS